MEQGAEVAVPGLCGDPVDWDAVDCRGGGVAGAQRVTRDGYTVESGLVGTLLHRTTDRPRPHTVGGGVVVPSNAREERTSSGGSDLEPGVECADRVSERVLSPDDSDALAAGVLVGLGAPDADQDPGWLAEEVIDVEC